MSAQRNMVNHQDLRGPGSVNSSFREEDIKAYNQIFDLDNQYTGKSWRPQDSRPTYLPQQPKAEGSYTKKKSSAKERHKLEERLESLRASKPKRPADMSNNRQHLEMLHDHAGYLKRKREFQAIEKSHEERRLLGSPQLSKKTLEVYAQNRGTGTIQDRLLKSGADAHAQRIRQQINEINNIKAQSSPLLSPKAQKLERNGLVAERLMLYQKVYRQNREKKERALSPQPCFSPKINKHFPVSSPRLTSKRSQTLYIEDYTFKPQLDPNSLKIAAQMPQKSAHNQTRCLEDTFPFHPTINEKSKKMDSQGTMPRWMSLYDLNIEKREQMELKRKEKQKEDIECTFQPFLHRNVSASPEETVSRLHQWQATRDMKIKKQQEEKADQEIKDCTFKPNPLYRSKMDGETRRRAEDFINSLMVSRIDSTPSYLKNYQKKMENPTLAVPFFEYDITSNAYGEAVKELHDLLHITF